MGVTAALPGNNRSTSCIFTKLAPAKPRRHSSDTRSSFHNTWKMSKKVHLVRLRARITRHGGLGAGVAAGAGEHGDIRIEHQARGRALFIVVQDHPREGG